VRSRSLGIRRMVWNSSGSVAGIGQTFLSTVLYLKTKVGLAAGSGGSGCSVITCSGGGGVDGDE